MTPPTFFLLVDGVPHELARAVWADGDLPGFCEPRPMVSVFPSLTEVAVPSMLREIFAERPPGYEARYYHTPSGEIRGGLGDPLSDAAMTPFRARPRGALAKAAVYVLRAQLAYAQIRWITHRFRQEGGPWLGYLSATDGVAHFNGREGLLAAFRDIVASVTAARLEHQRRHGTLPGVVLCSDHGFSFDQREHLSESKLAERLTRAGFRVGRPGPDGAVLVPHGDVCAGVVYCERSRAAEVAEVVAGAPGVDLAFAALQDGCRVLKARDSLQRARILWRGDAYRYDAEDGDPLAYGDVWRTLAEAGSLRDGWAADRDLFAATWMHRYPDALGRVRHAVEDLVQYPAPVLFSMRDGWTFGPALTHAGAQLLGGLMGSHGALAASHSVGFAAVTEDGTDPWAGASALRPEDVFRPWQDLVRAGSDGVR